MGDRATVRIVSSGDDFETAVEPSMYVHWDGEFARVYALCAYCRMRGYRCGDDPSYGLARLVAVAGNYIDPTEGLSLGVVSDYTEGWDNGHYTVTDDWRIVGWTHAWEFKRYAEEEGEECPWIFHAYTRPDGSEGREYIPTDRGYVERLIRRIHESMPDHDRISLERGEDPWD